MYDLDYSFRHLKAQVGIEAILSCYGLHLHLKRRGDQLFGPCPLHGSENQTAFRVNLERGLWHCFTACGGGDTVDLIRKIQRCSYREAARHLHRIATGLPKTPPTISPSLPSAERAFTPFTRSLPLNPRCHFLQNIKAISPATAARFEAGTSSSSTFLKNMVAVRLHDLDGNPLGYCGRRLDPNEASQFGKWRFPRNFPKAHILYNAHRARCLQYQGIILVECPWAVMRITQAGFPNAVALLGTSLSQTQISWLANASFILLMLDGDPAGHRAALSITNTLDPSVKVLQHRLPDNMEPEDLPDSSFRSILHPYFHFS
ncbi:MAG: toprim domain-containing protein [Deltaproteobacteria bacterium]|nr:toprim domain-containing protein [Deltaproteobacteria bacterium]